MNNATLSKQLTDVLNAGALDTLPDSVKAIIHENMLPLVTQVKKESYQDGWRAGWNDCRQQTNNNIEYLFNNGVQQ